MDEAGRFTGCMLGGAAGDALGYVIEYMDLKTIHKKYGPYGLRTVLKLESNGKRGVISDDTQMTIFTADGLLWAYQDGLSPAEGIYRSSMRWYYTQTERIVRHDQALWMKRQAHETAMEYDLMSESALFARRAPGKACLIALASGKCFTENEKANACKTSSVLRTAPVGLFFAGDPEQAFQIGKQAALMTHGGPAAYLAAGTFSAVIASLVQGKDFGAALSAAMHVLQRDEDSADLLKVLVAAVDEAVTDRNPVRAMKQIGLGWRADEALALSVYCLLKTSSLKDAVLMACNQDGDSDTCGAVTGNLAGAVYGRSGIPKNWLTHLECAELLEKLALRLYEKSGFADRGKGKDE